MGSRFLAKEIHTSPRVKSGERTDLWLVGYSSTVITSRAFHAAILVPQNRHCQPIIADSLLPKNRKKQQTAEMSMEPPVETSEGQQKRGARVLESAPPQAQLKELVT